MPQNNGYSTPNMARIVVTFEVPDEKLSGSNTPNAFWSYVKEHSRNGDFQPVETRELEERVVANFGRCMRELLAANYSLGAKFDYGRGTYPADLLFSGATAPLPSFAFQVAGFRYGSLSLDIDIAGLKGLTEFFDKNSDLLRIVLCQYAPSALVMAVTDGAQTWVDGLKCRMQSSAELDRAFAEAALAVIGPSSIRHPSGAVSSTQWESVNWAWIVSNTSLVVPVILSLVIVYFAFVGVDHERERLSLAFSGLADKQTEMLKVLASLAQQQRPAPDTAAKPSLPQKPQ